MNADKDTPLWHGLLTPLWHGLLTVPLASTEGLQEPVKSFEGFVETFGRHEWHGRETVPQRLLPQHLFRQSGSAKRGGSVKMIAIVSVGVVALLGAFLYLSLGGAKPTAPTVEHRLQENTPLAARDVLAKKTDLNTCRNALDQLNTYYNQAAKDQPPLFDPAALEALQNLYGLDPDEVAEIAGSRYTLLDGYYLDQCFLMRDAARSLETELHGAGGAETKLAPLDQATLAFAWVVREVRLQDGLFTQVPASFALRRGWGTATDRASVFLALLEQFGNGESVSEKRPNLLGCLVTVPDKDGPRLWACGVMVGDEPKLYLFDPRLGLPLPGPDGKGVATLAEVRQDPRVLAQLQIKGGALYDVTPEQAQKAEVHLTGSLSSLAPRLRYLQDKILAPGVHVHLAADALANEKRLKTALGAKESVKPDKVGLVQLRMFLSKEKGGANLQMPIFLSQLRGFVGVKDPARANMPLEGVFVYELAPWYDLPEVFRDQDKFPYNIGLGQVVRARYLEPFRSFALDADLARDQMLRGHYRPAIKQLIQEREECSNALKGMSKLQDDPDLSLKLANWLDQANKAYANADPSRAKTSAQKDEANKAIELLWQDEPIVTLLPGLVARTRRPETTYYLALCKHEMAEQAQARLDLAARKNGTAPVPAKEWVDALDWWERFVGEYPNAPEREAARRSYGRAQAMAGDREAAIKIWEGDAGTGTAHALEKLACLYLAEQARKK